MERRRRMSTSPWIKSAEENEKVHTRSLCERLSAMVGEDDTIASQRYGTSTVRLQAIIVKNILFSL